MNNYRFGEGLKAMFLQTKDVTRYFIVLHVGLFLLSSILSLFVFLGGSPQGLKPIIQSYLLLPAQWGDQFWLAYTLLTHLFFGIDVFTLLFNMLWLFWFGQIFLSFFKTKDFYWIYLGSGILGGIGFLVAHQFLPALAVQQAYLAGPAAAVLGILVATVTLVPHYQIQLFLFGRVKLLYLVIAYIAFDLLGVENGKAGATIAHLSGGLFAFLWVKANLYKLNGKFFKRSAKPKIKVVKATASKASNPTKKEGSGKAGTGLNAVDQAEIDAILDKISKSGYEKLTRAEKETLFKASKN
ncbi:MAG: rhomboid family intramembrane serine protease [Pedobacter sp.]|nr:MAG: rhomboid family intramembrane serine protease [Pedobacter sp.]